jgi:hypothetical protein
MAHHKWTKEEKITRALYYIVLLSFIIPIAFLIIRIAENDSHYIDESDRTRADYALMLVECILGIVVIHMPEFLSKKFSFSVPRLMYGFYIIFLYCGIFLGEVRSFFYTVPYWDTILHGFSSIMIGLFGFMVVSILNRGKNNFNLAPLFVTLFAFSFAVSIGTLWEIYEYVFDGVFGLNMQKFMLEDGTQLTGHTALADTMKDIIINCTGALATSVFGYLSLKLEKGWVHMYMKNYKTKAVEELPAETVTK